MEQHPNWSQEVATSANLLPKTRQPHLSVLLVCDDGMALGDADAGELNVGFLLGAPRVFWQLQANLCRAL